MSLMCVTAVAPTATVVYQPTSPTLIGSGNYSNPGKEFDADLATYAIYSATSTLVLKSKQGTYSGFGSGVVSGRLSVLHAADMTMNLMETALGFYDISYSINGGTNYISIAGLSAMDTPSTGQVLAYVDLTNVDLTNLRIRIKITADSDGSTGSSCTLYVYDIRFSG